MLNPLDWKPKHRAGLLVASIGGAVAGIAIGFMRLDRRATFTYWIEYHPGDVFLWALIGAIFIASMIYCYRMFSN